MTPEEALQILDNATAAAPLVRRDHIVVQQAIETLRKLIAEHNKPQDSE